MVKKITVQLSVRKMESADLEMVFSWRNHPDVRKYMYTRHEIQFDEHQAWFARASVDPAKHLLVFEQDSVPLGFINIQLISEAGVADWGFYVAPGAPRGTGGNLGAEALRYAFSDLGIHKICGQALRFNERSIRFHTKLGFTQEGVLRQQHFDGQSYHDVVCFGLLASEWQEMV